MFTVRSLVIFGFVASCGQLALGQAGNDAPVGSIVAWHKSFANSPALPTEWVECNGQVLNLPGSPFHGQTIPDLNGQLRFLRGGTASGADQEDATALPDNPFQVLRGGSGGSCSPNRVEIAGTSSNFCAEDGVAVVGGDSETRPVNMSVVWIMRVAEATSGNAPAVGTWGLVLLVAMLVTGGTLVLRQRRVEIA